MIFCAGMLLHTAAYAAAGTVKGIMDGVTQTGRNIVDTAVDVPMSIGGGVVGGVSNLTNLPSNMANEGLITGTLDTAFGSTSSVLGGAFDATGSVSDLLFGSGGGGGGMSAGGGSAAQSTAVVFDGPGLVSGSKIVRRNLDDGISHEDDLKSLAIGWVMFALSIVATVAVIAIIWAGILYITSFGDEGRVDTAKKIILYTVVGVLLIFGAYALVATVMKAVF